MITPDEAARLRAARSEESGVVSVYLPVPLDLAEHRGLPTKARQLARSAAGEAAGRGGPPASDEDLEWIYRTVEENSQEWLGHTIALFACGASGLAEAVPLPGLLPERAVVAARPYLRPLLAAIQRHPAYRVAIIDARHAWILAISDDRIETVAQRTDAGVPSTGFAGWYGLESHRIQQRIIQLSRQHFRDIMALLQDPDGGMPRPLLIGGQDSEVRQFLAIAARPVTDAVIGTFSVDLQTATPARVRELAGPVVAEWARAAEADLVREVLSEPPDTTVTTELAGCLAAIRTGAVGELILADEKVVPGFACEACGTLSREVGDCDCPEPGSTQVPVPDLLEVMAGRTLDAGGQVTAVREAPFTVAARLRFPVTTRAAR
ncbi:MAG: baeRF10 domain-containing protein [Streptosporangiaceae bacterium]